MTVDQALTELARSGMVGKDAETALTAALRGYTSVDDMLKDIPDNANPFWFMGRYGVDGGRAALVLARAA